MLDIEGTTSSIHFVYDVMFPYVRQHLRRYLVENWSEPALQDCLESLATDAGYPDRQAWLNRFSDEQQRERVQQAVSDLMDADAKVTGLKKLQGLIWQAGFESGQLVAHLFEEVGGCLEAWAEQGIDIRIYSSGSVAAQKLFFGHSVAGNLLPHLRGFYDTTTGSKQSADSYQKIASDFQVPPGEILFVSDVLAELSAARQAGLQTLLSVRPGNKTPTDKHDFAVITDFRQISFR